MISRPVFKSHIRVHLVPPDFLYFIGESGYKILQGKILYLLAPHLNGAKTTDQIAKKLKRHVSAFDVDCGILLLEQEGVIRESSASDLYLEDALNLDPGFAARSLKRNPVRIITLGAIDVAPLAAALRRLGIRVSETARCDLVVTEDHLHPELERIHLSNRNAGRPWLALKPTGTFLWIGPIFDPPRTPCWVCLAHRLRCNREAQTILQAYGADSSQRSSLIAGAGDLAFHLSALHAFKWLAASNAPIPDLITLDLRTFQLTHHVVVPVPECEFCGSKEEYSNHLPHRIKLKSSKKIFVFDGGHRVAAPEATFRRYEHLISPLTGIVDQVELSYSDESGLVHSYVAGHVFAPVRGTDTVIQHGLRQLAAGKGITPQQAKTGALCEALERYSGVFRGNEYRIQAKYRELGESAIHPQLFLNYSERQYRMRLNSTDRVPIRFDENRRIDWSPVWSLTCSRFKYVPSAYCYYGFSSPADLEFCRADSNGNAAGNTLEEAILHGFLELVERDSTAIWWYNRISSPGVDLESFASPYFPALMKYYRRLGLEVWMLNLTADFPIPCFGAVAASSDRKKFLLGFGAHLDATTAAARAITEMNQFLREYLSGGSRHVLKPRAKNMDFLKPTRPFMKSEDFPRYTNDDLQNDVRHCIALARSRGLEVLVLDQTRPEVGLPVVKVIVPGMRPLWPRFGEGRLYDVPVQLGRLTKPTPEKQLNPERIVV